MSDEPQKFARPEGWTAISFECAVAENGFVRREFDISDYREKFTLANNPKELRALFDDWAEKMGRMLEKWAQDKMAAKSDG